MSTDPGIAIPVSIDADPATVTIEKLAAKILDLEGKVAELGRKGKKAGEDIGDGFAQGLGQKAFESFKDFLEGIPGRLDRAMRASAEWADGLLELGQRSGFATTQLEQYSLAAKTSGLNLNSLTRFAQQLTPTLLKNTQAFEAIGLSFQELAGLNPGEQFDKVAKSLAGISDPSERLAKTVDIFGKRLGPQLQPFIDSLDTMRKRAEELGLVLDEKAIKAAADFNDELDTLKETQEGITRSLGGWITEDEDLRRSLHDLTSVLGKVNVEVQSLGEWFHSLPAPVKEAAAGLTFFGAQLAGALPTIGAFLAAAAQIKTLGGVGAVVSGFFTPIIAGLKAAGAAALGAAPALLAVAAAAAAIYGGAKLGEWLYENVSAFKDFTDWASKGAQALGEFLGLLPDEAERKKMEQGVAALSGATPEQLKALEDLKKRQADVLAGKVTTPSFVDPEDLKRAKELLALQNQLAAIGAQRAGAEAQAAQSRKAAVDTARADYEIQKATLDRQRAAGDTVDQRQYDQLLKVRDLAIQIANAQEAAAVRAAKLSDRTKELDQTKALADLEVQIGDARQFGLTALEQIDQKRNDSIQKAQAEHDLAVAKLRAEIEIGGLIGQARADKEKDIAQADAILAKQKELAFVVSETAMAERAWAEAKKFGIDLSERGLKAEREVLAEIDRALSNPKALIPEGTLAELDALTEKAKRLGQPFEELQARADAAFSRIESQGVQKALDAIADKLRRGVTLTDSDLSGLQSLQDGLSSSSDKARDLAEAIARVRAQLLDPGRITEAVQREVERKAFSLELEKRTNAERVKAYQHMKDIGGASAKLADEIFPEIAAQQLSINNLLHLGVNFMQQLGLAGESTLGTFVQMAAAMLQAADAGKAAKKAWDSGNKAAAVGAGLGVAGNIFNSNKQNLSGANAALSGAGQGAAFGAQFGPWGAAIGAVGGALIGFFSGSKFRKIAKDAGKVLGEGLSKETISKIEEDSKRLKVSIGAASLLNITTAIADTGKAASTFAPQINKLIQGIADKSVPAKEGIEQLGQAFGQVAEEALKANRVGDKALVSIIKQARASGVESPEIKAFVSEQLDAAVAGFNKFAALFEKKTKEEIDKLTEKGGEAFAGLSDDAVKKLADNAGVIFGATFDALVSEKGIVGAVDLMKDSFDTLRERLTETLGEEAVNRILGPFGAAFDTIGNEKLRPIFDGIDGLTQAMKGLANSGYLSIDAFTAMQDATATLFDEAIAGGADMKTALLAVAPGIQAAITAAEQFGVPLDEDTQRLKELAEQNGITFKTDPQAAMLDVLVSIAEVLGADIPESAKRARQAMEDLKNSTPGEINVGGGGPTGGTSGQRNVQANVTVNMGINENPLAAADTAAQMRQATIEWTADALQDRIPSIVAAVEGAIS